MIHVRVMTLLVILVVDIRVAGDQHWLWLSSFTYLSPDGRVCLGCGPGEFVSHHCVKSGTKSTCQYCPFGSFSATRSGATKCEHCQICNEGVNKIKDCTPASDAVCSCPKDTNPLAPDGKILLCSPRNRTSMDPFNKISTTQSPNLSSPSNTTTSRWEVSNTTTGRWEVNNTTTSQWDVSNTTTSPTPKNKYVSRILLVIFCLLTIAIIVVSYAIFITRHHSLWTPNNDYEMFDFL